MRSIARAGGRLNGGAFSIPGGQKMTELSMPSMVMFTPVI